MKVSILISFSVLLSLTGCAYKSSKSIAQSNVLKTHTPMKDVHWSGFVVETVNNKNNTCFQVIEVENKQAVKMSQEILDESLRFVACLDGYFDSNKYQYQYVRIKGDVISFYESNQDENDMPILSASQINLVDMNLNDNLSLYNWYPDHDVILKRQLEASVRNVPASKN